MGAKIRKTERKRMTAAMPAVIHIVHACVLCFFVSTLCLKKVSTFELSVTLSNLNRFSKFKGKRGFTGKAHAQFLPSYATACVVYFIVSNFSQRRRHKLRLNNDPGEVWLYIAVDCLDGYAQFNDCSHAGCDSRSSCLCPMLLSFYTESQKTVHNCFCQN